MIPPLVALFFACVAFIAGQTSAAVCAGVTPAADGPRTGKPPYMLLVVAAAVLGAVLAALGTTPVQLGVCAIVVFAMVACWCSDSICGFLPDAFTLGPLAALLLFAFAQHDWWLILSAGIVFVPFAVAAFFSRGLGMGWGDAKLVALTGAALGAVLGAFALAIACTAAVIVNRFTRGKSTAPIAFAPYIAALTVVALPLGLTH